MNYPLSLADVYLYLGKFTDGTSDGSIPPSRDPAKWNNDVTDEILAVITGAGLVPDEGDTTQLSQAINLLIAAAAISGLKVLAYLDAGDGIESDGAGHARVKLNSSTLLLSAAGLSLNLGKANAWAAGQSGVPVPVDDAAPAINLSGANVFYWSMGGARTLPAPTGISAGQSGVIWLRPNTHPLFYHNFWQFPGGAIPTVSTAAAARDLLVYEVDETAEHATCALIKGSA